MTKEVNSDNSGAVQETDLAIKLALRACVRVCVCVCVCEA